MRATAGLMTPTRRTMRQQTLTHTMGMTSPSATSTSTAAATAVSPAPAPIVDASDAKRTTRAQSTPTKPPAVTTTNNVDTTTNTATTTTTVRTPSPTRVTRTRAARSPAPLPVVRTPQLRPRRTPSSYVGLRDPYEQYALDVLRDECVRRGLSVRPREHDAGATKPATRGKAQLIELLQEADMLAMFERQSQKKAGRRSARTVRLTPPPTPIRIARAVATAGRSPAASNTHAAPGVVTSAPPTKLAPAPAPETAPITTATASVNPPAKTTSNAASNLTARKKPTRPPRKVGHVVATATTPAVTAAVQPPVAAATAQEVTAPPVPSVQAVSSDAQPPAAPWLTAVPVTQPPPPQISATGKADREPAAAPAMATHQAILLPNTVDLTEDEPTLAPGVQATMPLATTAQVVQSHQPMRIPPLPQATSVVSRPLTSGTSTIGAPAASRPTASATPTLVAAGRALAPPAIRARRGCRFRLINVVLSPDFNTRWSEMNTPVKSRVDVNAFWRDVHISFLCQNSFYDKVHFEDALFECVTPDLIQNHTAQKLQQMWTEIVSTYRRAHNASIKSEELKPFLDSCAGRLDVLYLHMALLLEPELHKLVLSETPRLKISGAKQATNTKVRPSVAKLVNPSALEPRTLPAMTEEPQLAMPNATVNPEHAPRFVELQNPEMLPDWLLEDQAKTAAERGAIVDYEVPQACVQPTTHIAASQFGAKAKKNHASKPKKAAVAPTQSPAIAPAADHASPVQTRDMVLHSSAINSIDDSASSDFEPAEPNIPSTQPTRRRAPGKRRREASPSELPSNELVEIASSRELVPHPHKRMHTAVTTTMTRSQEMVLPPDEFDIQTNRLRKINESIDQCYRTLSNQDAILNDMHREDVESDLRFYLGIKKRIQEQIVMFMHGF